MADSDFGWSDLLYLLENAFGRKRISANHNLNPNRRAHQCKYRLVSGVARGEGRVGGASGSAPAHFLQSFKAHFKQKFRPKYA